MILKHALNSLSCSSLLLALMAAPVQATLAPQCYEDWQKSPPNSMTTGAKLMSIRSTHHQLYHHNLELQIDPLTQSTQLGKADALWQKGLIYGDIDLVAQALQQASQHLLDNPNQELQGQLLRAKIELSMHRFAAAKTGLLSLGSEPRAQSLIRQINRVGEQQITHKTPEFKSKSSAEWTTLASHYLRIKQLRRAVQALNNAVNVIKDTNPIPLVSLHLLYSQYAKIIGDRSLSLTHLQRAANRLPRHASTLEALAQYYLEQNKPTQAIACLDIAQQHNNDPHLLSLLAKAHSQAGNSHQAEQLNSLAAQGFERVLAQYPYVYAGEAANYYFERADDPQLKPRQQQTQRQKAQKWSAFDANNRAQHQ